MPSGCCLMILESTPVPFTAYWFVLCCYSKIVIVIYGSLFWTAIWSKCLGDPKLVRVIPCYDRLLCFFCWIAERVPSIESFSIPEMINPSKLVSVGILLSFGLYVDPLIILSFEGLSWNYPVGSLLNDPLLIFKLFVLLTLCGVCLGMTVSTMSSFIRMFVSFC